MASDIKFQLTAEDQTRAAYAQHVSAVEAAVAAHERLAAAAAKSGKATREHHAAAAEGAEKSADPDPKGENAEQKATRLQKLGHTAKETAEAVASIWAANELSEQTIGRYIEAERAMLSLKQTLGATSDQFAEFREQVEGIAKITLGETNETIARVFETAKQLGAQGTEGPAEFAKVVSELANTTGISANRIAVSMGSILQASGETTEGAKHFADVFQELSTKTLGGSEALLATTQAIQGVASGFKITAEQMMAVASAGSQLGINGERFGMAFTQSLLAMQHSADDGGVALNDLAANMGTTREGFRDLINNNPTEAFTRFLVVLRRINAEGGSVQDFLHEVGIGGRNIEQALNAAANKATQFKGIVSDASKPDFGQGRIERDNAEVMKTVSSVEDNLRKTAGNALESVGAAFAPTLIPLAEALTAAINTVALAFNSLPGPARTALASFVLLTPSIIAAQKAYGIFKEVLEGGSAALGRAGGIMSYIIKGAREASVVEQEFAGSAAKATEATVAQGTASEATSAAVAQSGVEAAASAEGYDALAVATERSALATRQLAAAQALAPGRSSAAIHAIGTGAVEKELAGEAGAAGKAAAKSAELAESLGAVSTEAAVLEGGLVATTAATGEATVATGLLATASTAVSAAFAAMGGPITAAVVVGIAAAAELYEHWDDVLKFMEKSPIEVGQSIEEGFARIGHGVAKDFDDMIAGFKSFDASLDEAVAKAKANPHILSSMKDGVLSDLRDMDDAFRRLFNTPLRRRPEAEKEKRGPETDADRLKASLDNTGPINTLLEAQRDPALAQLDDTYKKTTQVDASQEKLNSLSDRASDYAQDNPDDAKQIAANQEEIEMLQRILDMRRAQIDPMFKITTSQDQQLATAKALTKAEQDRVETVKAMQNLRMSDPALSDNEIAQFGAGQQAIKAAEISKAYADETIQLENARAKAGAMTAQETQRLDVTQRLADMVRRSGYSDEQVAKAKELLEATNAISNAREQEQRLNTTGQAQREYEDQLATLGQRTAAGGDLANDPSRAALERHALDVSSLAARDPYAAQVKSARDLASQLSLVGDYQEADRKTLSFVNEEYDKGVPLTAQQVKNLTDINRQTQEIQQNQSGGFQGWANSLGTIQSSVNSIEQSFSSGIAGTIWNSIGKMRNRFAFRDFFNDLSGKVFEQSVNQALKSGMQATGLISGSSSSSATGGSIFDHVFGNKPMPTTPAGPLGMLNTQAMQVHAAMVTINGAAGGAVPGVSGGHGGTVSMEALTGGAGAGPDGTAGAAAMIRQAEGYRATAYRDTDGKPRIGYGSDTITDPLTGAVRSTHFGDTINQNAANADLTRRIQLQEAKDRTQVGADAYDKLSANSKAALTDAGYNYGSLPKNVVSAAQTGNADNIAAALRAHAGDNGGINAARREQEAQIATQQQLASATRASSSAMQSHAQATAMASTASTTASTAQTNLNTAATEASTSVNSVSTALKNVGSGTGVAGSPAATGGLTTDQSTLTNASLSGAAGAAGSAFNLPLLGPLAGWAMKAFQFHKGGLVGLGGTPIQIPPAMLQGAQRFHSGLSDDEFPAILQQGERVMTAQQNQMATRVVSGVANAGGSNSSSGAGSGNNSIGEVHIHQTVNPTGNQQADQQAADAHAKAMKDGLNQMMHSWAQTQMRPGGVLSSSSMRGQH